MSTYALTERERIATMTRIDIYTQHLKRVAERAAEYATALQYCDCRGDYYNPTCDVAYRGTRLWTAEQDMLAAREDTYADPAR